MLGLLAAARVVAFVLLLVAAGASPQPSSDTGDLFARYLRVFEGLWIRPLGLQGRELSLATNFYAAEGPAVVLIDVLGPLSCDTPGQPKILETQLMLSGGARVYPQRVARRSFRAGFSRPWAR
jgi:hypothetical protein